MRAAFTGSTNLEGKRVSDIGQRRQGSIARCHVFLRVDRLNTDLSGARFQMRSQAASNRRCVAPKHHRVEKPVRTAVGEVSFREADT